ncbi:sensor histidine kinase [Cucumibacter marinus]|uniref:sensor histidine kinase n=1 Tax=Cucumibacter marinus TaxID=1121252 RepID=UPI0003FD167A|nr:HAMP domain-containing sensor histidine kinase [Cucumibacter marinus]
MADRARQRRPSIAIRLAVGLALGTALLWVGAAAIAAYVLQGELNEAFDESLKQSAFRLLPLAVHDLREPEDREERDEYRVSRLEDDEAFFTYAVRDRSGRIVVAAEDAPDGLSQLTAREGFADIEGKRAFTLTDRRSGYSIIMVERTNHRSEALRDSVITLTWPLAGLIPLILAGIWFAVRLAMRPVERLKTDIEKRDGRDLSPPSTDGHPAELAPIAEAVAGLLDRLRAALDAERAFAASSAHELRTPIAGALAQTQRLAVEIGDHPAKGRIEDIEKALRHLSDLSEKLLQLSRLEAGFARSDKPVDLRPALDIVIGDLGRLPDHPKRVALTVTPDARLTARMDADAFAIALRNLIENALKHGAAGSVVAVTADTETISVVNDGPVVPADQLAMLGEPFVRGETAASGTGLGLAIVRSIMEQSGGRLTLHSPAAGRTDGFEAVITLPPL